MSLVRRNLLDDPGYTPYCGGENCPSMPRTVFKGTQFKCPACNWESKFDSAFIAQYKEKWNK